MVVEATLLDVDLPAEPRSAARARRAVLDALSGIAVDKDAVGIVVSEAVTNAVVHAYRDQATVGRVHVSASLDDQGVEVSVDDDGLGMRPRTDSPGVGLGLPLMGDLADRVDISSRRSGHPDRRLLHPDGPRRSARPLAGAPRLGTRRAASRAPRLARAPAPRRQRGQRGAQILLRELRVLERPAEIGVVGGEVEVPVPAEAEQDRALLARLLGRLAPPRSPRGSRARTRARG